MKRVVPGALARGGEAIGRALLREDTDMWRSTSVHVDASVAGWPRATRGRAPASTIHAPGMS